MFFKQKPKVAADATAPLPAIDVAAPTQLQTATFAMG